MVFDYYRWIRHHTARIYFHNDISASFANQFDEQVPETGHETAARKEPHKRELQAPNQRPEFLELPSKYDTRLWDVTTVLP